jgi:ribosomal protein L11 methyltransferase
MRLKLPSGLVILGSPVLPWEKGACDLKIKCGSAFHPRHVTSRLCLELLDGCLSSSACRVFLDIGCGSGILALAALRLGAATAIGVDIDPRAIHISRLNAVANGLRNRTDWILGASSAVRGQFDCVAANLPFPVLMRYLAEITSHVKPNGRLVISGFNDTEQGQLQDRLAQEGFAIDLSVQGDLSFAELPPSFSHTWVATSAVRGIL